MEKRRLREFYSINQTQMRTRWGGGQKIRTFCGSSYLEAPLGCDLIRWHNLINNLLLGLVIGPT